MAQRSDARNSGQLILLLMFAANFKYQGSLGGAIGFGIFQIYLFLSQSIPGLSGYMLHRYGEKWTAYKKRVPYKLFPGIL